MDDKIRLKEIAKLFGGPRRLAIALKITPSSITRRISGGINITERDKQNVNLLVDDRVKRLLDAKWL